MFKKCSHRENRSTTLSLRFAVWRSPNPSVAACISSNKFDSLHSGSILFFSLVSKSFKVISLFSYQGCLFCSRQAASVLYQSFHCLSRTFLNYFSLCLPTFFSVVRDSLFILSRGFSFVNMFFQCFFIFYKFFMSFYVKPKRRRWDLNPCAAVNDLLPFQGSPFGQLGYFSKLS